MMFLCDWISRSLLTMFLIPTTAQPLFSLLFFTPSKHGPAGHPPYCCHVPRIAKHVLAPPLSTELANTVCERSLSLVPLSSLIAHTLPVLPHSDIIAIMAEAWLCDCYLLESLWWVKWSAFAIAPAGFRLLILPVAVSLGLTLQKFVPKFGSANIFDRNNWFLNFITPLTGCFITL